MLESPLVDGRFLLLDALGRGGMATVYKAFDRVEERLVALKVQNEAAAPGPSHPLAAEYDAWARLDHPNIVEAFELAFTRAGPLAAGTPYLVLENVAGGPLQLAWPGGRLEPPILERLAADLLSALDHVHAAGLVHRDLKPANVLADTSDPARTRFKLTDFGLAAPTGTASAAGRVSGSLLYLAPEAFLGLPLDGRADLYGLGILLYQLATGELPFPRGDVAEIVRWHVGGPTADLERVRTGAPPSVARLVGRLTARDRRERPASAGAAIAELGVGGCEAGPRRAADRGERARMRLALDAARLGARRMFPLPRRPALRQALLRQIRFWSHVHALAFHDLGAGVLRLALRLLVDPRLDARALARRHALEQWLPIRSVTGVPVLDRASPQRPGGARASRAIGGFVLDCANERGLVLLAPAAPCDDPWTTAVVAEIARAAASPSPPRPGARGLLLLVAPSGPAARRGARAGVGSADLPLGPVA